MAAFTTVMCRVFTTRSRRSDENVMIDFVVHAPIIMQKIIVKRWICGRLMGGNQCELVIMDLKVKRGDEAWE